MVAVISVSMMCCSASFAGGAGLICKFVLFDILLQYHTGGCTSWFCEGEAWRPLSTPFVIFYHHGCVASCMTLRIYIYIYIYLDIFHCYKLSFVGARCAFGKIIKLLLQTSEDVYILFSIFFGLN